MYPALAQPPKAQRHQSTHSDKVGVPLLFIRITQHKRAYSSVRSMHKVHEIFADSMQARRQALVLHSIERDIGQVALPRDRVAWAVLAAIRSIGQVHSPNPFVKDDLKDGSDRRVLAGGHWPAWSA